VIAVELRVLLVVGALAAAVALGLLWRARNGRFAAAGAEAAPVLATADLGAPTGSRATFVQLSSETCAPCRSTAAVLRDLAAAEPGVTHVELDAAERIDLVRRFGVLRTPTVLVLDGAGAVRGRFSGGTTPAQARAALAAVVAVAPVPEDGPVASVPRPGPAALVETCTGAGGAR
jgi:thiol-disulfide isomerase/thioredoxin